MASYGWDDCHTIYNGILDRVYPTTDRLSDLRTELQVPEDATILTTISRIDPKKDLVTMLRSFRVVLDCRPNTYLLIAGGGFSDYHRTLVEEAHRLDIIDHVRFLGFRDDVAELIALGEISLLSSVTEGLPNAVLESMLLARPVVATAVGGVPELIEDGIEGYLVNSGDSQSFADRVIELIDNPVRREAMGIFGRARALADFSVQTTVEKTTANYAKHLTQREHKEYTIPAQDVREPWEATTPNEWARTA